MLLLVPRSPDPIWNHISPGGQRGSLALGGGDLVRQYALAFGPYLASAFAGQRRGAQPHRPHPAWRVKSRRLSPETRCDPAIAVNCTSLNPAPSRKLAVREVRTTQL